MGLSYANGIALAARMDGLRLNVYVLLGDGELQEGQVWEAVRIDGHDVGQICETLDRMDGQTVKPLAIIADTIKGKGVSFLEGTYQYHNSKLSEEQYLRALEEIQESLSGL
jgi:transketolase